MNLLGGRTALVLSSILVVLGLVVLVETAVVGGGTRLPPRRAARPRGRAPPLPGEARVAKKRPVLARVLGARSIGAVAYGEIGSSLFVALGIVALYAGALLPWVLLAVGILFFCVALSYAEGVAAIPETGGGAMLARRAFNDPIGFLTGWVLLLDYVVVIALAALFVPHYAGAAFGWDAIDERAVGRDRRHRRDRGRRRRASRPPVGHVPRRARRRGAVAS